MKRCYLHPTSGFQPCLYGGCRAIAVLRKKLCLLLLLNDLLGYTAAFACWWASWCFAYLRDGKIKREIHQKSYAAFICADFVLEGTHCTWPLVVIKLYLLFFPYFAAKAWHLKNEMRFSRKAEEEIGLFAWQWRKTGKNLFDRLLIKCGFLYSSSILHSRLTCCTTLTLSASELLKI